MPVNLLLELDSNFPCRVDKNMTKISQLSSPPQPPHRGKCRVTNFLLSLVVLISFLLCGGVSSLDTVAAAQEFTPMHGNNNFSHMRSTPITFNSKCSLKSSRVSCGHSLVCVNEKCVPCQNNQQCVAVFGEQSVCHKIPGAEHTICQHKPLFPNISWEDIVSFFLNCIGGAFAASSGLGGAQLFDHDLLLSNKTGGIFVPLLIAVGGFSTSMAIPLSKAMIFGASIANFIMFFPRKHPLDKKRPLIDYDTVMLLEPATLLGTIVGVFLNIILPEYITLVMLLFLLSITTFRTVQKGIRAWRSENQQRMLQQNGTKDPLLNTRYAPLSTEDDDDSTTEQNEHENEPADSPTPRDEHSDAPDDDDQDITTEFGNRTSSSNLAASNHPRKLKKLIRSDHRILPLEKYFALLLCWIIVFGLSLLKGGHGAPSVIGIKVCSAFFWIITFSPYLLIGGILIAIATYLIARHQKKVRCGYKFLKGDVHWNLFNTIVYPFFCLLAGVAAGCLGIGGGMLKGPVLVELGLLPETIVASSSFMIMFTSSITTAQFTILGRLPFDYGIAFAIGGFVSALIGQIMFEYVVKRFDRPSLLVLLMAGVIGVSTLLMGVVGTERLFRDINQGAYMGFNLPC